MINVEKIKNNDVVMIDYILNKHYAQRKPSISYAYRLKINDNICGFITFGKPASNSLCEGVCGKENKHKVYELNRLITDDDLGKNILSKFVSKTLKMLPRRLIIISYADTGMNHSGYIYQATNFIYTGKTKQRTDKYVPNGKHSRHYTNKYNHLRKVRTAKHRYVTYTGKQKHLLNMLKYPTFPYPKDINKNYKLGEKQKEIIINRKEQ